MAERKAKIDRQHAFPLNRQCKVLGISRSSAYRVPAGVSDEDLGLMQKRDALHLKHPFKGSRRLRDDLWDMHGLRINRKRMLRMMRMRALYPAAKTTRPDPQHKLYP